MRRNFKNVAMLGLRYLIATLTILCLLSCTRKSPKEKFYVVTFKEEKLQNTNPVKSLPYEELRIGDLTIKCDQIIYLPKDKYAEECNDPLQIVLDGIKFDTRSAPSNLDNYTAAGLDEFRNLLIEKKLRIKQEDAEDMFHSLIGMILYNLHCNISSSQKFDIDFYMKSDDLVFLAYKPDASKEYTNSFLVISKNDGLEHSFYLNDKTQKIPKEKLIKIIDCFRYQPAVNQ